MTQMQQGFFDKPFEGVNTLEYLSASKLNCFNDSERAFARRYLWDKDDRKPTPAMLLGKYFHRALLEPEKFNPTEIKLTASAQEKLAEMLDSVSKHPLATKILTGGEAEKIAYYFDHEFEMWVNVRCDYVSGNYIAEVKTARSAKLSYFQRELKARGYYIQMALYRRAMQAIRGTSIEHVPCIVTESVEPYVTEIYYVPGTILDFGDRKLISLVKRYKDMLSRWREFNGGFYPKGYNAEWVTDLNFSSWDEKTLLDEIEEDEENLES